MSGDQIHVGTFAPVYIRPHPSSPKLEWRCAPFTWATVPPMHCPRMCVPCWSLTKFERCGKRSENTTGGGRCHIDVGCAKWWLQHCLFFFILASQLNSDLLNSDPDLFNDVYIVYHHCSCIIYCKFFPICSCFSRYSIFFSLSSYAELSLSTFGLAHINFLKMPLQLHNHDRLVVSNIFYVHPYLGKWSNLTDIFFKKIVETTN